jgi:hypothetical protein
MIPIGIYSLIFSITFFLIQVIHFGKIMEASKSRDYFGNIGATFIYLITGKYYDKKSI